MVGGGRPGGPARIRGPGQGLKFSPARAGGHPQGERLRLKMALIRNMDESVRYAIRATLRPKKSVLSAVSLKEVFVAI